LLVETGDIEVAGEAENSGDVLNELTKNPFDIILLDVSMPGRGGIDTLRRIKTKKPDIPVLMLSVHPEEQYAVRAIRNGAAGYLTKDCPPEELVKAIRKVISGGKYIRESVAERLASDVFSDARQPLHALLSDREFEVLRKIASGKTVSEIAGQMSLSVKTISTYRTRILEKMNMETNAQLTHYCFKNNIVD
jgi:DNA-binding NarL/FixJ family response regulator